MWIFIHLILEKLFALSFALQMGYTIIWRLTLEVKPLIAMRELLLKICYRKHMSNS